MSEQQSAEFGGTERDATVELVQAVYDRVNSYEEAGTPETIRRDLDEALAEAGADLDEETRNRLVQHIDDRGGREDVAGLL